MSDREDLGALGCTRDGYQLIGVGMALNVGFVLLGLYASSGGGYSSEDPLAGWFWALHEIAGWLGLLGGGLLFLGVGATALAPHGPFPRWPKRVVLFAYAFMLLRSLVWRWHPFEDHRSPYMRFLGDRIEQVYQTLSDYAWPVGVALLSAFTARFALRRGLPVVALAWSFLGLWTAAQVVMPLSWHMAITGWWGYANDALYFGACAAALYLARRLRLSIREAAEASP